MSFFEFLRPVVTEVGILFGDCFTFLSTLNDDVPLKFRESEHDVPDELASRRRIDNAHIKDINNYSFGGKVFDELN